MWQTRPVSHQLPRRVKFTLVNKVQRVMNCAARLFCKVPRPVRTRRYPPPPPSPTTTLRIYQCRLSELRMQNILQDCYNLLRRGQLHWGFSLLVWHIPSRTLRFSLCWYLQLPYFEQTQEVPRTARVAARFVTTARFVTKVSLRWQNVSNLMHCLHVLSLQHVLSLRCH